MKVYGSSPADLRINLHGVPEFCTYAITLDTVRPDPP